jgi:ABC-type transporter Mla subunit MlaD
MAERLKALEEELENGLKMLSELDRRRAELRDTLLRITGAIEVLREFSDQGRAQVLAVTGE